MLIYSVHILRASLTSLSFLSRAPNPYTITCKLHYLQYTCTCTFAKCNDKIFQFWEKFLWGKGAMNTGHTFKGLLCLRTYLRLELQSFIKGFYTGIFLLWLIDWLIIYCFKFHSRLFHWYGDVTITGGGLQNLGLCSALMAFDQGGIFIVPHLLWHGAFGFPISSEGSPHFVAFYNTQGDVEDLF
jgi:hypothetical protein